MGRSGVASRIGAVVFVGALLGACAQRPKGDGGPGGPGGPPGTGDTFGAPANVWVGGGFETITVGWNEVASATSYNIYFAADDPTLDPDNWSSIGGQQVTDATSPFELTDLVGGTTYYVLVTAVGSSESGPSTLLSAIPLVSGGTPTLGFSVAETTSGDRCGYSLASGDFNGDGLDDLAIGCSQGGDDNQGSVDVYYGQPDSSLLEPTPRDTLVGEVTGDRFGNAVSAGDINGDGKDDLVVGAQLYSNVQGNEGKIYLFLGSASGVSDTAYSSLESDDAGLELGNAIAVVGDLNGDGYEDVVRGSAAGGANGEATAYLGSASPTDLFGTLAGDGGWLGVVIGDDFGTAVAAAGDVNGDGLADLVVGAPGGGTSNEGLAYVLLGTSGAIGTLDAVFPSGTTTSQLGSAVGGAGDVNGDGFADVLAGAESHNPGGADNSGAAFLLLATGGSDVIDVDSPWTAVGVAGGDRLGTAVRGAGDINGDGFSDVLVGAPAATGAGFGSAGTVSLYLGGASGAEATEFWSASADQNSASYGAALVGNADFNGDGVSDMAIGALDYDGSRGLVEAYSGFGPSVTASEISAGTIQTLALGAVYTPAEVSYTLPGAHPNLTCYWTWGDGSQDEISDCTAANVASIQHVYLAAGTFYVVLRVEEGGVWAEGSTAVIVE